MASSSSSNNNNNNTTYNNVLATSSPSSVNSNNSSKVMSGGHHHHSTAPQSNTERLRRVEVVCRFRPQLRFEVEMGGSMCVHFFSDIRAVCMKSDKREIPFAFDRVFSCDYTQEQVFQHVGLPVVNGTSMLITQVVFFLFLSINTTC